MMKVENKIISGILGFTIGCTLCTIINVGVKQVKEIERDVIPIHLIQENINTCEDMVEWMNYDIENYVDSTIFDDYIYNLEQMTEENMFYKLNTITNG